METIDTDNVETKCGKLKRLDREYGTYPWSPLHHDQNCKECN